MVLDRFSLIMIAIFVIGYLLIAFENAVKINKTTSALMTGVLCWVVQFANVNINKNTNLNYLFEHLSEITQVIIFILGSMIIIEVINSHQGFKIITNNIAVQSKRKLLWIIGIISFFFSAVLDNLTTSIVMISIVQKMMDEKKDRMIIGGGVVIAANAGGCWSPIGDVTSTMLWIGGQVSAKNIILKLLIPSLTCFISSFLFLTFKLKGKINKIDVYKSQIKSVDLIIFILGIGTLLFVPIFKSITGLPPFMGIIFGLSLIWFVTDILYKNNIENDYLKIRSILSKIDISGPLFFLGILLAVNALETQGILKFISERLSHLSGERSIATFIGLASSVFDNIPIVAASMGMYELGNYPIDSAFWHLIAYCAGTGGSILIIGSAAGIVYMSLEKADFFFYLKKITIPAIFGYFIGLLTYLITISFI